MLNVEKIQELLGNEYTCEAFTERKNNLTLNRVNIQKKWNEYWYVFEPFRSI